MKETILTPFLAGACHHWEGRTKSGSLSGPSQSLSAPDVFKAPNSWDGCGWSDWVTRRWWSTNSLHSPWPRGFPCMLAAVHRDHLEDPKCFSEMFLQSLGQTDLIMDSWGFTGPEKNMFSEVCSFMFVITFQALHIALQISCSLRILSKLGLGHRLGCTFTGVIARALIYYAFTSGLAWYLGSTSPEYYRYPR